MIETLQATGYGIIGLAVIIGIGMVVLSQMGTSVASCNTGFSYQTNGSRTYTTQLCCNVTTADCLGKNSSSPSSATQSLNTIGDTYLGTNLAGWIPVVIVLLIGMLFLGAFLARKGKQS